MSSPSFFKCSMRFFILLSFVLYVQVHAENKAENITENKILKSLEKSKISKKCQAKFVLIANHFIGPKRHRVLEKNISNSTTFHVFILLSYNDQDSHLSFTATETEKGCEISMNESYELPANCLDARNSIFKRWELLGKLNEKTMVFRYDYARNKKARLADENARAMGFLTQTRRGEACLISKQQQNMPEPPKKEEDK